MRGPVYVRVDERRAVEPRPALVIGARTWSSSSKLSATLGYAAARTHVTPGILSAMVALHSVTEKVVAVEKILLTVMRFVVLPIACAAR